MPSTQPTVGDDDGEDLTPTAVTPTANTRPPRRILPGWAIDLIRDGVDPRDLAKTGHKAVYMALNSTALAAVNAGWSRPEWEDEVESPRSKLGLQNRLRDQDKVRSKQSSMKSLNTAWERAEKYAAAHPAWTREQAHEEAQRRAQHLQLVAADPEAELTDGERLLLLYVADLAASLNSSAVNLPRAATAQATGLGEKAVRLALPRLVERGLLDQIEHGRARTKTRPGRANTYRIPEGSQLRRATSPSRVSRQVGPSTEVGRPQAGSPTGPRSGTGAHLSARDSTDAGTGDQKRPGPAEIRLRVQRGIETLAREWWARTVEEARVGR